MINKNIVVIVVVISAMVLIFGAFGAMLNTFIVSAFLSYSISMLITLIISGLLYCGPHNKT